MGQLTYSVSQAAAETSLHPRTIFRLIRSGELKSKLVGRRRLIDARSLHQYVGVSDEQSAA